APPPIGFSPPQPPATSAWTRCFFRSCPARRVRRNDSASWSISPPGRNPNRSSKKPCGRCSTPASSVSITDLAASACALAVRYGELNMNPTLPTIDHLTRRAFLKGVVATGTGLAVPNWGGLVHSSLVAAEAASRGKRCILLWMNGGASQFETFDMKPGRPTGGLFRPIATKVTGLQICDYMPKMAQQADKLAVIRSMRTESPDHPDGIYHMHTGYKQSDRVPHPEIGAMVAKYLGRPESDLPSFLRMGPTGNAAAGYLGPQSDPFGIDRSGRMPYFTAPYTNAESEKRRTDLLKAVEEGFGRDHQAEPFAAHRLAKERAWRLLRAKSVFDIGKEWPKYRDLYGDTDFGRGCMLARRLVEAGVPFVE